MKHSHKRVRKIAEAVFRGQKTQYKFDVFPLTADITDAPAIFIISRRITDKFRKGHHSAVCLGETDSIRAEIKKHKRAKCVKQHAANVVCILKDVDKANRSLVVDDLQTARSFSCIRNADQPNIKAKSNVKTKSSTPVAATAPKRRKADVAPAKPSKPANARVAKSAAVSAKTPPAKPTTAQAKKAKRSKPAKITVPKPAKAKPAKKNSKITAAKLGKAKSSRAVAARRPAAKRTSTAAKPAKRSTAPAKRKSSAKKPVAASPKRRTRVQSGVDSKRGQHRLSKPKKPVDRRAKSRTVGGSRSGKKAAA